MTALAALPFVISALWAVRVLCCLRDLRRLHSTEDARLAAYCAQVRS